MFGTKELTRKFTTQECEIMKGEKTAERIVLFTSYC